MGDHSLRMAIELEHLSKSPVFPEHCSSLYWWLEIVSVSCWTLLWRYSDHFVGYSLHSVGPVRLVLAWKWLSHGGLWWLRRHRQDDDASWIHWASIGLRLGHRLRLFWGRSCRRSHRWHIFYSRLLLIQPWNTMWSNWFNNKVKNGIEMERESWNTPLRLDFIDAMVCHWFNWGLYFSAVFNSLMSSRPPTA